MGDKPFFVYFAPGRDARAAPRADGVVGEVQGQVRPGLGRAARGDPGAPEGARRRPARDGADRPARRDPAWEDIPDDLKPVLARQMEVYAGFMEHTDHHVGRLVDALDDLGVLEDTLVYYIVGDNGASAEGDVHGCFNELINLNGAAALQTTEFMAVADRRLRHRLRPTTTTRSAGRTRWTPRTSGRSRSPPTGAGPATARSCTGRRDRREGRGPPPVPPRDRRRPDGARGCRPAGAETVHGVKQNPIEGVSMHYAFDDADAAERRETQYFEMFCNRGIYHKGWTAVTRHSTPWVVEPLPPFADDVWELYDTSTDWSQAHDLAAEMPEKLEELKALFMDEARKYNVLPLDDRRVERFNSDSPGARRCSRATRNCFFGGMGRLTENVVINIKNKSHSVTAELTGSRRRRRGRDRLPGRRLCRLEPLRQERQADVLLQPLRPPALPRRRRRAEFPAGHTPGADGVRLRRRRARQGRHRVPLPRRREDRRGSCRRQPSRWSSPPTRPATSARDTASPVSNDYTAGRAAASRAPWTGCRSTSTRPPRTSTTSSRPRSASSIAMARQ